MRKYFWLVLVVFPICLARAQAAVEPSKKTENEYVICRNSSLVRTIRVDFDKSQSQCITFYTKSGVDKEVARGQFSDSCVKVLGNIRSNLEKASWKCREVDNVSFHGNN